MLEYIFDSKTDDFMNKYLYMGSNRRVTEKAFFSGYELLQCEIGELILRHDGIAFKVFGDNFPLAFLINTFGIKGFNNIRIHGSLDYLTPREYKTKTPNQNEHSRVKKRALSFKRCSYTERYKQVYIPLKICLVYC